MTTGVDEQPNPKRRVRWVAVIDSSTCDTCAMLDGIEFVVGSRRGPPLHAPSEHRPLGCRCTFEEITAGKLGSE